MYELVKTRPMLDAPSRLSTHYFVTQLMFSLFVQRMIQNNTAQWNDTPTINVIETKHATVEQSKSIPKITDKPHHQLHIVLPHRSSSLPAESRQLINDRITSIAMGSYQALSVRILLTIIIIGLSAPKSRASSANLPSLLDFLVDFNHYSLRRGMGRIPAAENEARRQPICRQSYANFPN